jgi:cytochrome c-type biogenesis protein
MGSENLTVGLAALAGLASFLSPCVLALVPAYVGYLGGRSVTAGGEVVENRWDTFSHGLAFVGGFSLVFIALGAGASAIGAVLFDLRPLLTQIGGVVVVVFGLHTMGILRIPFLDMDTRRQVRPSPSLGYLSSALMGVFFSAGWSPCVGPVLGAVLTMALDSGQLNRGVVLLAAYSAGLAVPFLLAALGVRQVTELMRRHRRLIRGLSIATGALLVVIGVLLFTGAMSRIANALSPRGTFIDFGL